MNNENKLCVVSAEQGQWVWNMLLSDDQIKVFEFLKKKGWDFEVTETGEPIVL